MASKKHFPMPIEERAKQFHPFAAVTGLEAALRRKEHEMGLIDRIELSEERVAEINRVLQELHQGDAVTVDYFAGGEYLSVSGHVERISAMDRTIDVDGVVIAVDDIYCIAK